jgi:hypothetical protein
MDRLNLSADEMLQRGQSRYGLAEGDLAARDITTICLYKKDRICELLSSNVRFLQPNIVEANYDHRDGDVNFVWKHAGMRQIAKFDGLGFKISMINRDGSLIRPRPGPWRRPFVSDGCLMTLRLARDAIRSIVLDELPDGPMGTVLAALVGAIGRDCATIAYQYIT